tara:strand:- start:94 stop:552 length:459 start_codon:yes stop_codon:yes gene_type:complete
MIKDFSCGYCDQEFSDEDQLKSHYWNCLQSEETKEKIMLERAKGEAEKAKGEAERAKLKAYKSTPEGLLEAITKFEKRYENLLKKNAQLDVKFRKLSYDSGVMEQRTKDMQKQLEDMQRAIKILMDNNVELGRSIEKNSDRAFLFAILGMNN